MTNLIGTRFGDLALDERTFLDVPRGLVGFPNDRRFALLERATPGPFAWLQSIDTPSLALSVYDATGLDGYPSPSAADLAAAAGLGTDELVVLVTVAVRRGAEPQANLLAPILVHPPTRRGHQIVLDPRRYSARAALVAR